MIREVATNLVGQNVSVSKAPLVITADNETKVYGQSFTLAGNAFTASTLYNGDTVTSVSLASLGAAASSSVAGSPYAIVPSSAEGSGLGNYTISYDNGTLTVQPAPLTITAVSKTTVAGQAVPPLTPDYSGFVNGDTAAGLTSQPVLTTTATSASSPGVYSIVVSGAASPNYHISFVDGTITVTPSSVTVTGPPPTIVGESVVITQKHNKKGKKIGKPILSGYTITFSTAMDQTALATSTNYEIAVTSIKTKVVTMGHKRVRTKVTVLTPIAFSVSNATSNSVTLAWQANKHFPKAGRSRCFTAGWTTLPASSWPRTQSWRSLHAASRSANAHHEPDGPPATLDQCWFQRTRKSWSSFSHSALDRVAG